ncbi:chromate ion transporter [Diaporthe sp. PMI_573]|nr:chromate ion transporter [Diaporthaceae sp. PMI_573]
MAITGRWGGAMERARKRVWNTVRENWYLGFTSFGGPPVHFKIFHDKFTIKLKWIDEQVYQELFSVCQALSGPGSTKMHYCINLIHDGFLPAVLSFLVWSLPGALAMYALSVGVSNISETLPRVAYALLSGSTQQQWMTRILVFLGGAAGMLYNALWYFPLLMLLAGLAAVVHDYRWVHKPVGAIVLFFKKTRGPKGQERVDMDDERTASAADEPRVIPPERRLNMSWKLGLGLILAFLASFIVIMVLRGLLVQKLLLYRLFANMYLAGTIIFGGGPVVIPLLREYVVAEGWVSPRDFLIGLAIIQAFPGPNFNFAVYLGSLTASGAGMSSIAGAVLGYLGIFLPGMWLVHGTIGIWGALRGRRWVKSMLRGVNAGAVGLIYTAVYRLWQIGYIDKGYQDGTSLAVEPWWVVVTATSYVGGMWFGVKPAVAIIMGAVLGLIWYGVVTT